MIISLIARASHGEFSQAVWMTTEMTIKFENYEKPIQGLNAVMKTDSGNSKPEWEKPLYGVIGTKTQICEYLEKSRRLLQQILRNCWISNKSINE